MGFHPGGLITSPGCPVWNEYPQNYRGRDSFNPCAGSACQGHKSSSSSSPRSGALLLFLAAMVSLIISSINGSIYKAHAHRRINSVSNLVTESASRSTELAWREFRSSLIEWTARNWVDTKHVHERFMLRFCTHQDEISAHRRLDKCMHMPQDRDLAPSLLGPVSPLM